MLGPGRSLHSGWRGAPERNSVLEEYASGSGQRIDAQGTLAGSRDQ